MISFFCQRVCRRALFACVFLAAGAARAANGPGVRAIEDRFVAPCCWHESVVVHQSDAAAEMRAEIERLAAAGWSEQQIVDAYVSRYGERILREPRGGKKIWLTLVPVVSILLATAGLLLYLRSKRRSLEQPVAEEENLPPVPEFD